MSENRKRKEESKGKNGLSVEEILDNDDDDHDIRDLIAATNDGLKRKERNAIKRESGLGSNYRAEMLAKIKSGDIGLQKSGTVNLDSSFTRRPNLGIDIPSGTGSGNISVKYPV